MLEVLSDPVWDGGLWDMMIAHPPCTHLAASGARWFKARRVEQALALAFVRILLDVPIERIALENPVGMIGTKIRPPDQVIQPHWFGHDAAKATCLWLKGLPKLIPTRVVDPGHEGNGDERPQLNLFHPGISRRWANQTPSGQNKVGEARRSQRRSATYSGIAQAMAEQWAA